MPSATPSNITSNQRCNPADNSGFSLINIMIAIAVVAILAGAVGPMVFRQIMQARELETLNEMNELKAAHLKFFDDMGRFPTQEEGLAALVITPASAQWQGPYLPGEPLAAITEFTSDTFGQDYIIDLSPETDPASSTELLIASSGIDQSFSSGSQGSTWTLNGESDDLIVLVESGPINRDKIALARDEMQNIRAAAQKYFYDHAAFPAALDLLEGTYLDGGFSGDAFVDPWSSNYTMTVDNAAHPPVMMILSSGPDRAGNSGSGDDISLTVDSVGPGRQATQYRLNIIQGSVDISAATDLTGEWDTDRESFNLGLAFSNDGWGNLYEEAMSSRTILSGGPDANIFTAADNIPAGVVPDDEGGVEPWDSHGSYTIGDVVSHNGSQWECRQSHDGNGDPNWAPGIADSLWLAI